mmetsp:Transcript_21964/g.44037  ORF Transcript_21964/g.44037 Transcript_21964/m.44037 type:complete len:862 (+) Transcript_21964:179-2764(+)
MNTTDLLFGGPANGSSSPVHSSSFPSLNTNGDGDGEVGSLMSPVKPRSQEDISSYTTPLRLGLNLGRSQSAAPETWEYGNSIPSSTKSERYKLRDENGFFGRSGIFEEEEEDRESFVQSVRRPASTGVIGRRNESEDVNSILETLGLASLESSEQDVSSSYVGNAMGGIGSYKSPVKQSMMAKIREGGDTPTSNSNESNNFFIGEERQSGSNPFANQGQVRLQNNSVQSNGSSSSLQQQGVHYQYPAASDIPVSGYQPSNNFGSNNNGGPPLFPNQMNQNVQQPYQVNNQTAYQPQQNVYYQQPPQMHSQQHHVGMIHGAIPQTNAGQPAVYHMSAAAPPYGYQQQLPPGVQMVQQVVGAPGGQPQYISIVPIQAPGGPPGGHTYSYVQYGGEGFPVHSQPMMAAPTYVMGPHGPIAIQNPAGAIPIHNMGYSPPVEAPIGAPSNRDGGLSTSPQTPGGGRGMGKRTNGLSTPRGKRNADKNAVAPSKLGPEATILLNEIRAAKSRNQWSIHDIKGFIVEFCLDQNGSRFIQQRLEVADPVEKQAVMEEVLPAIHDLLNDVFGNYVVQKLFEFGTESLLKDLKGALEGNMLKLSLQMYGCRVTQKALESLAYDDLCSLLHEFDQNVLTCIQDQNGNHVMQKIVEVMSISAKEAEAKSREDGLADAMAEKIQFVVDDVLTNVETLCCHPYGCRVLQRMLEHCVDFQKTATLDKIQLCHKTLMDDQYGNYVIQHVLQYGRDSDRDSLLQIIVNNDLLKLSRQKFASNVVEKLLKYGNSAQRNTIVREMLKVVREGGSSQEGVGSTVLLLMVRDAYANYVVQTAIDVVPEGKEKQMLLEELKANEAQLRNYTFAKHIVAKLGSK